MFVQNSFYSNRESKNFLSLALSLSILFSLFLLTDLISIKDAMAARYQTEISEVGPGNCIVKSTLIRKLKEQADSYCENYGGVLSYGDYRFNKLGETVLQRKCQIVSTVTCNAEIPRPRTGGGGGVIYNPPTSVGGGVSPQHKGIALVLGMANNCSSCEADASVMTSLLQNNGFTTYKIIDPTSDDVKRYLYSISQALYSGDYFVLYFSGHGGQVADLNGDEEDGMDEVLVLNDRNFLDDELATSFSYFNYGVKMLFLSDSCNSGSVYKNNPMNMNILKPGTPYTAETISVIDNNKNMNSMRGQFVAITSSRDDQNSRMGAPYSHFTSLILNTWNNGYFSGNLRQFYSMISSQSVDQQPQYFSAGPNAYLFESERPFTIR